MKPYDIYFSIYSLFFSIFYTFLRDLQMLHKIQIVCCLHLKANKMIPSWFVFSFVLRNCLYTIHRNVIVVIT